MTQQPDHTSEAFINGVDGNEGITAAMLTLTAQQAVLPRQLEEGIYSILDADGAVQIVETKGYAQERKHAWNQAHSDTPEFVHRQVTLLDVGSFIDYLAHNTDSISFDEVTDTDYTHGNGELELWADIEARTIKAVLDGYNGLRKHTATLQLKISREWGEWMAIDGKLLDQVKFAEFIEDHLSTIAQPDGAQLLDICQTLEGTTGAVWKQQGLLRTGQRAWSYEEVVEAKAGVKGNLQPPEDLTLVLRPFQGSDPIPITARFRIRPNQGAGVQIGVKLAEPEKALEDAFALIVGDVQARVPVHVNNGRG
jgi:uncharacterized protein YfdQ (DUF2303 family)